MLLLISAKKYKFYRQVSHFVAIKGKKESTNFNPHVSHFVAIKGEKRNHKFFCPRVSHFVAIKGKKKMKLARIIQNCVVEIFFKSSPKSSEKKK